MEKYYCIGAIVKAIAGREKEELFMISHIENNYVYLINGKSRTLDNPKKKNLKHIYLLSKSKLDSESFDKLSNSDIIKILKDYKSGDYK